MGNKTGKFDVPKTDNEVKDNEVVVNAEHQDIIKEEKVETALETEPKQNGDANESKEIAENAEGEKKEEAAVEESKKTDTTETTETKKKGVFGWLKKISFRKDKKQKTTEENHEENKEENKEVKPEEVKSEESPATDVAAVIAEESEKVEESKPEESHNVEENKKDDEAKVSE